MALLEYGQAWCETTSTVGSQKEQVNKVLRQKIAALVHLNKHLGVIQFRGSRDIHWGKHVLNISGLLFFFLFVFNSLQIYVLVFSFPDMSSAGENKRHFQGECYSKTTITGPPSNRF